MIKSQTAQLAELANSVGECKDVNDKQDDLIKSQTAQLAELANSVGECKDINEDQAKQIKDLESSTAECSLSASLIGGLPVAFLGLQTPRPDDSSAVRAGSVRNTMSGQDINRILGN